MWFLDESKAAYDVRPVKVVMIMTQTYYKEQEEGAGELIEQ